MNTFKTGMLMFAMTGLLIMVGGLIGKSNGVIFAFVFAMVMNGVGYWFSDKIALGMSGARPVDESEAPELYGIVQRLCVQAQIPMPKLYIAPSEMPNAFATGRDPEHAAVVVYEGLLRILGHDEVEGVLAHELSHVKNRDILISSVAATLAGAVMMLSNIAKFGLIFGGYSDRDREGGGLGVLVGIIVAPIAAMLIQLAVSRSREYQADATGAQISGKPLGLANALMRLDNASQYVQANVSPSSAHMYIVNPLHGGGLAGLFSTHPPIAERVDRLKAIARDMGQYTA
jgi:heat shock protein HtpX